MLDVPQSIVLPVDLSTVRLSYGKTHVNGIPSCEPRYLFCNFPSAKLKRGGYYDQHSNHPFAHRTLHVDSISFIRSLAVLFLFTTGVFKSLVRSGRLARKPVNYTFLSKAHDTQTGEFTNTSIGIEDDGHFKHGFWKL